jgi:hypothetical protein
MRGEENGSVDPGGELGDVKALIGGVVNKKSLVARFSGVGWGNLGDAVGHAVNEHLAPLDVRMGGEGSGSRQGSLDSADYEVMGCGELGQGGLRAHEND